MKRLPKQLRIYITILTVIALGLVGWSAFFLWTDLQSFLPDWFSLSVFAALALILEFLSVKLPAEGYAPVSLAAYLALFVRGDFSIAVTVAAVSLIFKEIIINRERFFIRLADFSVNIICIASSGVVYLVLNGASPFLTINNIIALTGASVLYYSIDFFLRFSIAALLDENSLKNFKVAWGSYIIPNVAFLPLSVLLVLTYNINPLLAILCAVPLLALIRSIRYGMKEIVFADQEKLVGAISSLQTGLKKAKETAEELNNDLNKKIEEQTILIELGEKLGASLNLKDTLETIVTMIRKLVPYQSCVIFLIENGSLYAAKPVSPYKEVLEYSSLLKMEESFVTLVIQNKKPMIVPEMQASGDQRIFKDERSMICVPLIVKNEIIGVIYVGANKPGTYNEDHMRLLTILGNAASNAIKTAQLYKKAEEDLEQIQKSNQQMTKINENNSKILDMGQKLGSSLNSDEAQKIVIDGLERVFKYDTVIIFTVKAIEGYQYFTPSKFRSHFEYEEALEDYHLVIDDTSTMLGWIARNRKAVNWYDTSTLPLMPVITDERSVMIAPMVVENEITGAIYLGHSRPDMWTDDDIKVLEAISQHAAMAFKNADLYEQTHIKSITDGLTGLYTHRYFQERLTEEINHARRRKVGLALVMIDADHFKSYNDTLGHPEGDMVLKTVADLMRKYTRDSDLVCRIGGDEFTVLLKEIDKENAYTKAEAIRAAVEATFRDHKVQITTSIGLACFPEDAGSKKDLVAAADAALYKSKKAGRNQVTIASGPVGQDFVKKPLPRA